MGTKRGMKQLLEAMYLLNRRGIKLYVDCIGRLSAEVKLYYESLPFFRDIKKQIKFLGFQPLPEAYAKSNEYLAGLSLLDYTVNHALHAPTKQYEYMAAGLPVLISDFPKHKKFVEKYQCGIAVDINSAEEIARALEWLYLQQDKAIEMGRKGREWIEKGFFNWESEEKKLLNLYKRLL
jgi:glycosyltransferase involved in cell wall biosynthesis